MTTYKKTFRDHVSLALINLAFKVASPPFRGAMSHIMLSGIDDVKDRMINEKSSRLEEM